MMDFYAREIWRFVYVQQEVAKLGETAIEFPPMQAPASFNIQSQGRDPRADQEDARRQRSGQLAYRFKSAGFGARTRCASST